MLDQECIREGRIYRYKIRYSSREAVLLREIRRRTNRTR
jgi:hypothetical protein